MKNEAKKLPEKKRNNNRLKALFFILSRKKKLAPAAKKLQSHVQEKDTASLLSRPNIRICRRPPQPLLLTTVCDVAVAFAASS